MSFVFGAILPHGPIVPELTENPELMAETRAAMEEAGRRFCAAKIDTLILLDPFSVHACQAIALDKSCSFFIGESTLLIGTTTHAAGTIGRTLERFVCDVELAEAILNASQTASFPVKRFDKQNGDLELEWGAMIPLWYTIHPLPPPRPRLVVIAPSPMVPREALLRFGGLLAKIARDSGKRIALIASADQAHRYDSGHPRFGFSPASAQHDALYCKAVADNNLDSLLDIDAKLLEDSFTDSLWQTLILAGALKAVPMPVNFLSFAVPSYFGMAVALYENTSAQKP